MIDLRPFDPSGDGAAVFELWNRSLGHAWTVGRADFDAVMREGLVGVDDDGGVVGAAMFSCRGDTASLQLLVVDPALQRQGCGAALHEATVAALGRRGVTHVRLAGTPGNHLWPGLPSELSHLRQPLERRGWNFRETCWDLVRSLDDYRTPEEVAERATDFGFRWAAAADRAALLEFERTHFPQWLDDFVADEELDTAIVAVGEEGQIVGSLLAADQHQPQLWRSMLGDALGTINAVGVDERVEGRGVGTRMVAYACEQLQARGVINCHISWVVLLSFYGRLGFTPWREYERAELELSPTSTRD